MSFQCCDTLEDKQWGKLYPREFINIRGDVRWRHPLHVDYMFCLTCENQLPELDKKEARRI